MHAVICFGDDVEGGVRNSIIKRKDQITLYLSVTFHFSGSFSCDY